MSKLVNSKETIEILKKYNFNFQKKFGQNFLIDPHVLDKIADAAKLTKDDLVLEIGPGIGTMTQELCERAGHVIAVEIDRNLIPILENDTLAAYDNKTIINSDVLELDLKELIEKTFDEKMPEHSGPKRAKVVANLPYYITTPIIMGLLEKREPVESITVMVQKEVAMRMQAGAGSKDYGALSLAVQYYAEPYLAANVPQNCFIPRPNVGSAVIRLSLYDKPPVEVNDEKLMFRLIRAAFNQRRKTLVNAIRNSAECGFTKEEVETALESLGLDINIRGEALSLSQFAKLSDELGGNR